MRLAWIDVVASLFPLAGVVFVLLAVVQVIRAWARRRPDLAIDQLIRPPRWEKGWPTIDPRHRLDGRMLRLHKRKVEAFERSMLATPSAAVNETVTVFKTGKRL